MKFSYILFALGLTKIAWGKHVDEASSIIPGGIRAGGKGKIDLLKSAPISSRTLQQSSTNFPDQTILTTPYNTDLSIPLLGTGVDAASDELKLHLNTAPAHGTVLLLQTTSGNHEIKYKPDQGFIGFDEFLYNVTDGTKGYASSLVVVEVLAPQSPSGVLARDDLSTTNENTPVKIYVLKNDISPDGTTLKIGSVSTPEHGSVEISDNSSTITYTPSQGFVGSDQVNYTIMHANSATRSSALVTIEVTPTLERATKAVDDVAYTYVNTPVTIHILDNDIAGGGDTLKIDSTTNPLYGSVDITNWRTTLKYTPNQDFVGTDSLSYRIVDADSGRSSANVKIHVMPSQASTFSEATQP